MNRDEKIAYDYLQTLNFGSVKFEPNGNVPPDFLINDQIAVEVRRLNQHIKVNGTNKPLEELYFKLVPKTLKIIEEFETENFNDTLIISIEYGRPLKVDRSIYKQIKESIKDNLTTRQKNLVITLNENLKMRFYRSDKPLGKSIILGSSMDENSGGFIVGNIYENLKYVIREKEEKIEKYLNEFERWWLILIDYIGYGLSPIDIDQLNSLPNIESFFDKILLISPTNDENTKEIKFKDASA